MLVLPSRPFATKRMGRFWIVDFAFSSSHTTLPSFAERSTCTGGWSTRDHVSTNPLPVRRELRGVGAVAVGQLPESRSIQPDAAQVEMVGVLVLVASPRPEPHRVLVDVLDLAHNPVALGQLAAHLAGATVVAVQVVPAVALRHPEPVAGAVDAMQEQLCRRSQRTFS